MNLRVGVFVASVVFLVLVLFFSPKQYAKVDDKALHWAETLPAAIWKTPTDKYTVFQVQNQGVIIPRESLSDFQSQTMGRGMQPRILPIAVPVTERNYVYVGMNWSVMAFYVLLALAVGSLAAVVPGLGGLPCAIARGCRARLGMAGLGRPATPAMNAPMTKPAAETPPQP